MKNSLQSHIWLFHNIHGNEYTNFLYKEVIDQCKSSKRKEGIAAIRHLMLQLIDNTFQRTYFLFLISKKIILKNTREQRQHKGYREGNRKKKEKKRKKQKHKKNNKD